MKTKGKIKKVRYILLQGGMIDYSVHDIATTVNALIDRVNELSQPEKKKSGGNTGMGLIGHIPQTKLVDMDTVRPVIIEEQEQFTLKDVLEKLGEINETLYSIDKGVHKD